MDGLAPFIRWRRRPVLQVPPGFSRTGPSTGSRAPPNFFAQSKQQGPPRGGRMSFRPNFFPFPLPFSSPSTNPGHAFLHKPLCEHNLPPPPAKAACLDKARLDDCRRAGSQRKSNRASAGATTVLPSGKYPSPGGSLASPLEGFPPLGFSALSLHWLGSSAFCFFCSVL